MKAVLFCLATVLVAPLLAWYWLQARLLGPDRALFNCSQLLALAPGLTGQFLRRAFYARTLAACHRSVTIEFGALFSRAGARLGRNVYVGPLCHIGLADVGDDVLIAAGAHVPSGPHTHGTAESDRPIREQPGELRTVRIGAGTWVGAAAVVLADVGAGCIIGAGSVVTQPLPDRVVAAGVPARVLRPRGPDSDQRPAADWA